MASKNARKTDAKRKGKDRRKPDGRKTSWQNGREPSTQKGQKNIQEQIRDPKILRERTGISKTLFRTLLLWVTALIYAEERVLWRLPYYRKSEPGNRCILSPEDALFLYLVRLRTKLKQTDLGCEFGTSQPTVSRYLARMERMLGIILPTGGRIMRMLRRVNSLAALRRTFPFLAGKILVDGTHIRYHTSNTAAYSGKKRAKTLNTVIATMGGIIMGISNTDLGSTHDITLFKEMIGQWGGFGSMLCNPRMPHKYRIILLGDKGFQGWQKILLGADAMTPYKEYKNRQLTAEQKHHNRHVNSERIFIEYTIGRLKNSYKAVSYPHKGAPEQLNTTLDIVTGLVNLQKLGKIPPALEPKISKSNYNKAKLACKH